MILDSIRIKLRSAERPSSTVAKQADFLCRIAANNNCRHRFRQLSPRQREILRYIGWGKSDVEIARELFLSPNTVRTHRQNIRNILQVRNSIEAIWYTLAFEVFEITTTVDSL